MTQRPGRAAAKYRQVAGSLRSRIEAGELPVGAQLPTKFELSQAYEVSLGTIDNALRVLCDLGMVETRQGAGTFVLSRQAIEEPDQETVRKLASQLQDVLQRLGKVEKRLDDALEPDGR